MPKAILEFGVRGGHHVDNLIIPSTKLAARIAVNIIDVLDATNAVLADSMPCSRSSEDFYIVSKRKPRASWQSSSHFVSVSMLDGNDRGAAAAKLWRK